MTLQRACTEYELLAQRHAGVSAYCRQLRHAVNAPFLGGDTSLREARMKLLIGAEHELRKIGKQLAAAQRALEEAKPTPRPPRPKPVPTPAIRITPPLPKPVVQPTRSVQKVAPSGGNSLFPPLDFSRFRDEDVEIDGSTTRIREPDGIHCMLTEEYWRQRQEWSQRHGTPA